MWTGEASPPPAGKWPPAIPVRAFRTATGMDLLSFLMRFYRSGPGQAFNLELRHGLLCIGCCWALMLVMFAAGVALLYWMAVLGLLMLAEKAFRGGEAPTAPVGVAVVVLAALAVGAPGSIPGL